MENKTTRKKKEPWDIVGQKRPVTVRLDPTVYRALEKEGLARSLSVGKILESSATAYVGKKV